MLQLKVLRANLSRMISKQPYELRESINGIVDLVLRKSEETQTKYDCSQSDCLKLRAENKALAARLHASEKADSVNKEKICRLEERVTGMKDDLDYRQKYSVKNSRYIATLSSSNRLMIDSLNAIKDEDMRASGTITTAISKGHALNNTNNKEPSTAISLGESTSFDRHAMKMTLLRTVRDNYQCHQSLVELEHRVEEYRESLRRSERQCRTYQLEVEELKRTRGSNDVYVAAKAIPDDESVVVKRRTNSTFEDRLELLLSKNAMEPLEVITKMKMIFQHLSACPFSLDCSQVAYHLAHDHAARAIGVDVILIFLKCFENDVILKYSPRSQKAEILYEEKVSVLATVFATESPVRCNVLDSGFDLAVDGCLGLKMSRLLSIPIRSKRNGQIIGVIHFLNKTNGELFSEVDEMLGVVFADQAALPLSSVMSFDILRRQYRILQGVEEAATLYFSNLPDPSSASVLRPVDIMVAVQKVVLRVLRVSQCAVFLESQLFDPHASDKLLRTCSLYSSSHLPLEIDSSGVVSLVLGDRKSYVVMDCLEDAYFCSKVDLDPVDEILLSICIMDFGENVLGCIQIVVEKRKFYLFQDQLGGSGSGTTDDNLCTGYLILAEKLGYQLVAPIKHSLQYLDKQFIAPSLP